MTASDYSETPGADGLTVFTVGHSVQPVADLLALLRAHDIDAVADVRSTPYSRRNPQYNRENLARALRPADIRYVWLGDGLGARPDDPACYVDGSASYARIAETPAFRAAIDRVIEGAARWRIALMCAEKDPAHCHRAGLVAPALVARGVTVRHILADATLEGHGALLARREAGNRRGPGPEAGAQPDLFGD